MRSPRTRWALGVFIATVALAVLVSGWAAWETYCIRRQIRSTQTLYGSPIRLAYQTVADELSPALAAMHESLREALASNAPFAARQFQERRAQCGQLLDGQAIAGSRVFLRSLAPIPFWLDTGPLLDEINAAFTGYTNAAQTALATGASDTEAAVEPYRQQLAQLATRARLQNEMFDLAATETKRLMRRQQWLFLGLLILAGACGVLAASARWHEIGRLRRTIVAQEAALANQQKLAHFGELAAGLAHEIRNPLTAINARLFALELALRDGTPEREDASVIRREITRLDQVIGDFLKLARPAEPKLAPLTAGPLLQEVVHLLAPDLARKSVELSLGPVAPDSFPGDAGQLKQVLINLVKNAADSCRNRGRVRLQARRDTARLNGHRRDAVILEVADNGAGIPPEIRDRLFDPFFSTKDHGTGLGLAISAHIVAQHRGTILCQTEVGRGTTFQVVLPREEVPPP